MSRAEFYVIINIKLQKIYIKCIIIILQIIYIIYMLHYNYKLQNIYIYNMGKIKWRNNCKYYVILNEKPIPYFNIFTPNRNVLKLTP